MLKSNAIKITMTEDSKIVKPGFSPLFRPKETSRIIKSLNFLVKLFLYKISSLHRTDAALVCDAMFENWRRKLFLTRWATDIAEPDFAKLSLAPRCQWCCRIGLCWVSLSGVNKTAEFLQKFLAYANISAKSKLHRYRYRYMLQYFSIWIRSPGGPQRVKNLVTLSL